MRNKISMGTLARSGLLLLWSVILIIPLMLLLFGAVKSSSAFMMDPYSWPDKLVLTNFSDAWNQADLARALLNSVLVTGCSILSLAVLGSAGAYPLARRASKLSSILYIFFISGIMLPFQLAMIPLYKLMGGLHLTNTYFGAIMIYVASTLPFVIFLYTGFLKSVPRELEEAATIDGCGPIRTFVSIIFPLLKPVTATVVITNSLNIWNDFLVPLLFLQEKASRTIPMAIFTFVGQYNNNWSLIFASIAISSLPLILLFLLLQKYFIKGIAGGAVKG
ncbi:carbohydrate ABC transporter permease [Cohnella fermenti]|uniref:Carbohydrate ABC transporter permease n=1 Tax=Cohnella fermenti TaxID=2565925 RepID=A0A4S4BF89_9BACL|nr:carbohydrate ABC transporter permease [Cohnella fermenti]THF72940.1 carbohydrate ABC transporter permease [Cohnella fermenti]